MTKSPERLLRSHVVAYLLGYRETDAKPAYGTKPKTAAERLDETAMSTFRVAVSEGRVPRADKYIGRIPHWKQSTIDAFIESTPTKPGRPASAKREVAHA